MRKISRREFLRLAALGGVSTVGSGFLLRQNPALQGPKRAILPFLSLNDRYDLPTAIEDTDIAPVEKPWLVNERHSIEDKIAELFVTDFDDIRNYIPGGVLLTKDDTRLGHLFGKFSSYDPKKTQASVERIIGTAQDHNKRILIYDEGEGGYVMRVGALPAATDIGDYYTENIIRETVKSRVVPSASRQDRVIEVQRLFRVYAQELKNRGTDVVLAPCLDVVTTDRDNVIRNSLRNYSTSHSVTRKIARLYIQEMQRAGIRTIGKHFLTAGLTEEDPHEEVAENVQEVSPRLRAGHLYRVLKNDLDGVMVTHVANPSDLDRPYSVSKRAYHYLTLDRYPIAATTKNSCFENVRTAPRIFRGIGFKGVVIVDDLSMRGLLDYLAKEPLSERGEILVSGCTTPEARAAVIALDQGADMFIAKHPIDDIVDGLVYAYRNDNLFRKRVERALRKYRGFVR